MEWIQFIQEAEAWLRPLPITIQGVIASEDDQKTWKHALVLQCCYCAELETNSHLRNPNQLKQWLLAVAAQDVGILGKKIKEVAVEIRHYPSQWEVFDLSRFKAYCNWSFMGTFFSPIRDYLQSYLQNPAADTLHVLLQWTCFLTRITLETGNTTGLEDYLQIEDRLRELEWSPEWDQLKEVLRPIAMRYEPKPLRPTFSQGANSDSPRPLGLWGKLRLGWSFSHQQRYLLAQSGWRTSEIPDEEPRSCSLIFVPKGIDSKRAICEEPAANMFLQQGVLRDIDDWFSTDSEIKRYINLHDQSQQRARAQHASVSLAHATLDLSAASDSVSWRLVQYLLDGTPLFEDLRLTRTETVKLPNGVIHKLEKFAPMGSALCFPTECLIFLGICLLGCRVTGASPLIGVYGDDLIVPSEAEDEVARLLQLFGFKLNDKKSFWGLERFKESCGGEYFDGIDVTPVYIPRKFSHPRDGQSPELMSTYTDLANTLFVNGYRWMRRYVLSTLLLPHFPGVLFSSSPEKGVQSTHPTNFHLKERWNSGLQRLEVRRQYLKDTGDVVVDDDVRYLLTLIRYRDTNRIYLSFPEDRISVKLTLPRVTAEWEWYPEEDTLSDDSLVATDGSVIMLY